MELRLQTQIPVSEDYRQFVSFNENLTNRRINTVELTCSRKEFSDPSSGIDDHSLTCFMNFQLQNPLLLVYLHCFSSVRLEELPPTKSLWFLLKEFNVYCKYHAIIKRELHFSAIFVGIFKDSRSDEIIWKCLIDSIQPTIGFVFDTCNNKVTFEICIAT